MPTSRTQHDPFTDAPLRPTTSNVTTLSAQPSLRSQTSGQSLRSNASTASSRQRQQNTLFAPALSRRPNSRATPRTEGEVLAEVFADEDSEQDFATDLVKQKQMRRVRHGSPEKHSRLKAKQDEELDFVNRRPDGSFLLGVSGFGEPVAVPQLTPPKTAEEAEQDEVDAHYVSIARHYFAGGTPFNGRTSKKQEEDLETLRLSMMLRLREQVVQQLDEERWMYEPVDRYYNGIP